MITREFDNHLRSQEDITLTGTFVCLFLYVFGFKSDSTVFMMLTLIMQIKSPLVLILMLL